MPNLDATKSENIEQLQQIRATSKYYNLDSPTIWTNYPQHRTAHLFAIQKLGVEKADSLYTKAKSQIDIDPKQFKNNPVYAKNINAKIITNYKKLIIEEANKKYRPEIVELENKIKKLEATPDVSSPYVGSLGPLPGSEAFKNQEIDNKKRKNKTT